MGGVFVLCLGVDGVILIDEFETLDKSNTGGSKSFSIVEIFRAVFRLRLKDESGPATACNFRFKNDPTGGFVLDEGNPREFRISDLYLNLVLVEAGSFLPALVNNVERGIDFGAKRGFLTKRSLSM